MYICIDRYRLYTYISISISIYIYIYIYIYILYIYITNDCVFVCCVLSVVQLSVAHIVCRAYGCGHAIFSAQETSPALVCRTSPVSIEKTARLRMIYLWFLAQKIRNRMQHAAHGNPRKDPLGEAAAKEFVSNMGANDR